MFCQFERAKGETEGAVQLIRAPGIRDKVQYSNFNPNWIFLGGLTAPFHSPKDGLAMSLPKASEPKHWV